MAARRMAAGGAAAAASLGRGIGRQDQRRRREAGNCQSYETMFRGHRGPPSHRRTEQHLSNESASRQPARDALHHGRPVTSGKHSVWPRGHCVELRNPPAARSGIPSRLGAPDANEDPVGDSGAASAADERAGQRHRVEPLSRYPPGHPIRPYHVVVDDGFAPRPTRGNSGLGDAVPDRRSRQGNAPPSCLRGRRSRPLTTRSSRICRGGRSCSSGNRRIRRPASSAIDPGGTAGPRRTRPRGTSPASPRSASD